MDGQLTFWYHHVDGSRSLHFTQAPQSSIVQISLAGRSDLNEEAVPIADAYGEFAVMTTKDGTYPLEPPTFDLIANDLTELEGYLWADNCAANFVVNFFYWPSVF